MYKREKEGKESMGNYYLAVDIGASSGRHILGAVENGKIVLEEIHRFENGMVKKDGHRCWDTEHLFREIKAGIKKCKEIGKIPVSMGIDTWAVDYVLLDENGKVLGNTYGYRDSRMDGMDEEVYKIIPEKDLYARTGIQKQMFNTIYQLMAHKVQEPELLGRAKTFLMLPDYFQFLLTGSKVSEYTNATSGQLVSPVTKQWDMELIGMLGYPEDIFLPLSMPGTVVGKFSEEVEKEAGFSCEVVLPATHDTASAVMAVPTQSDECLYISSGTWSLMGVENKEAICSIESMENASSLLCGFPRIFPSAATIVSAPMTSASSSLSATAFAFKNASSFTILSGAFSVTTSSASLAFTVNTMPACAKSSRRLGDAEASTICFIFCLPYIISRTAKTGCPIFRRPTAILLLRFSAYASCCIPGFQSVQILHL